MIVCIIVTVRTNKEIIKSMKLRYNVTMDQYVHDKAKDFCKEENETLSALVNRLLLEYVTKHEALENQVLSSEE